MEDSLEVSCKTKHTRRVLQSSPAVVFFGTCPRRAESLSSHTKLLTEVYSSFTYNSPTRKQPRLPRVGGWIHKLVHPDSGILFSAKRGWAIKPWKDTEELYLLIRWKEPVWKDYRLHDSHYMALWKRQNYGDNKQINGLQGLSLMEEWTGTKQRIFRAENLYLPLNVTDNVKLLPPPQKKYCLNKLKHIWILKFNLIFKK